MRSTNRNQQAGFTLIEIMVTVFVLSVGIMGSLMYFSASLSSAQLARDVTVATSHAEYLLEEMRTRPTLSNITSTSWDTWASGEGIPSLPSESVSVTYVDAGADPLNITAEVSWARRSGSKTVSLNTELTK